MPRPNFFCGLEALQWLLEHEPRSEQDDIDLTVDLIEAPYLFLYSSDADAWELKVLMRGELYDHESGSGVEKGSLRVDKQSGQGSGKTTDPVLRDNLAAFFEACRRLSRHIRDEDLEPLYRGLDPEKAGVLLEVRGDRLQARRVAGRERPDLVCTTLSGANVLGRPYMEDFMERSMEELGGRPDPDPQEEARRAQAAREAEERRKKEEAKKREAASKKAAYEKAFKEFIQKKKETEEQRREGLKHALDEKRASLKAQIESRYESELHLAEEKLGEGTDKKRAAEQALSALGLFAFGEKKAQKARIQEAEAVILGAKSRKEKAEEERRTALAGLEETVRAEEGSLRAEMERRFPMPKQPNKFDYMSFEEATAGMTAKQVENEGFKQDILAWMEPDKLYRADEILASVPSIVASGMSANRVAAIMTQLCDAGQVERAVDKRVNFYRLK